MSDFRDWIGKSVEQTDTIDVGRARAMQATLDRAPDLSDGDALPPLWHWIYFWETAPASALGRDGHAARGGFLPPIALPHRMWAGGRLRFHRPLRVGGTVRKTSTVADVTEKQGRSGRLAFVTVRHEIADGGGLCLVEEQDIVYREARRPGAAPQGRPASGDAVWRRHVRPDPVLLFRYSALTFNGHRIHYDQPYATGHEGYPGLIVHGPLLATLLIDLLLREGGRAVPAGFDFRALRPVFDTAGFDLRGQPAEAGASLWVADADGCLAMEAKATD